MTVIEHQILLLNQYDSIKILNEKRINVLKLTEVIVNTTKC
jgi:hypothetical protein